LLKELVQKCYSDPKNPKWLASFVDEFTFKKSLKNNEKNSGKTDPERAYWGLTLGECFTLLNNNFERVRNIFTNDEEHSFSNQQNFKTAGIFIGEIRAKVSAHATGSKVKKSDMELLRIYMNKVLSCLQAELSVASVEEASEAPDQLIEEE